MTIFENVALDPTVVRTHWKFVVRTHWTFKVRTHWTFGARTHWTFGIRTHWTFGVRTHWTFGVRTHCTLYNVLVRKLFIKTVKSASKSAFCLWEECWLGCYYNIPRIPLLHC